MMTHGPRTPFLNESEMKRESFPEAVEMKTRTIEWTMALLMAFCCIMIVSKSPECKTTESLFTSPCKASIPRNHGVSSPATTSFDDTVQIISGSIDHLRIIEDDFEESWPGSWRVLYGGPSAWWAPSTNRVATGNKSVHCAAGGTDAISPGGPYLPNMNTWMIIGPFDLSNADSAQAVFSYWMDVEEPFDGTFYDGFSYMVSLDGDLFYGYRTAGTTDGWTTRTFDFSDVDAISVIGQPEVWFCFRFFSDSSVEYEGVYVDQFRIEIETPEDPCEIECSASVPDSAFSGQAVQFSASATATSCPAALNYHWDFGDGNSATAQEMTHSYDSTGTYTWKLEVSSSGTRCSKTGSIAISSSSGQDLEITNWIPVVSHAGGANASQWRTDLGILNSSSEPAGIRMRLHLPDGTLETSLPDLAPGVEQILCDVVGQFPATGSAALEVISDQPLVLNSRTYNQSDSGTFGQGLDSFSDSNALEAGDRGFLLQLAENSAFRTNIAIANGGKLPAEATVELFSGNGVFLAGYTTEILQGKWIQENRPFANRAGRTDIEDGYALITVSEGDRVAVYASVVDATTNDPTTVNISPAPAPEDTRLWFPVASHVTGSNNSRWRTDLAVLNPSAETANLELRLHTSSGILGTKTSVAPEEQAILGDVVSLFGYSGSAALEIVSDRPIAAVSRTYNLTPNGTFGQGLSAVFPANGLETGQNAVLPQLIENDTYRSNIALTNTGDTPAEATVELFDGAGRKLTSYTVTLAPGRWKQENRPFFNRAGQSNLSRGYARIRVESGSGIVAYGSVIDSGTNDPTTISMKKIPTASAVIGPDGGSITAEGIEISFPPGVLDSATLVEIMKTERSTALDRDRNSPVFEIRGLDVDDAGGATITLEPETSRDSGDSFLVIEENVFVTSAAAICATPRFLETRNENGTLIALMPQADSKAGRREKGGGEVKPAFSIWSISGYHALISPAGKFYVLYPVTDLMVGGAEEIARTLDSAYEIIRNNLGLSWSGRTRWPISVEITKFSAESQTRAAECAPSRLGINYYWLHVNEDRISTIDDARNIGTLAAHELMHLMQAMYDSRNRISTARSPGIWFWFDEAMAVWFESVIHSSTTYLPDVVTQQYWRLTEHGLEYPPGTPDVVQNHGYAGALFIRYLANRYGPSAIGDILKKKKQSYNLPVDAIDSVTGARVESAWRFFTREFCAGNLFGTRFPTTVNLLYLGRSNQYTFDEEDDTGTTFQWAAPDLSLRVYSIKFQDVGWEEDASLKLSLSDSGGDAAAHIFRVQGSDLTNVAELRDGQEHIFEHAEDLVSANENLIIVIGNANAHRPYNNSTEIKLEVALDVDTCNRPPFFSDGTYTISTQSISCGGSFWMSDWKAVVEGTTISLSQWTPASNVDMTGEGNYSPNPECRSPFWLVDVPFEYRYTSPNRGQSWSVEGKLDGGGYSFSGTITTPNDTCDFENLLATWHW